MRPLLLLALLTLPVMLGGCKRKTPPPGEPGKSSPDSLIAKGQTVPRVAADQSAAPADRPKTVTGGLQKVDCALLLSADRAGSILGKKMTAVDPAQLPLSQCRWVSADGATVVNAQVMCRESAVRLYRTVDKRLAEGHKSIGVGHKSVLLEEKDQVTIQVIDEKTPCGAEVTVAPPTKGAEVARAVFDGLHPAMGR